MAISESQLETWSHIGAVDSSARIYQSVRNALEDPSSPLFGMDFEIYLQGSYRNSTNIYGDSDVDIVAELHSSFYSETSALSSYEAHLYKANSHPATYHWQDFKRDVIVSLQRYFGADKIEIGNKSLKVSPASSHLRADVIPALQYRKYVRYGPGQEEYVPGIKFFTTSENREVINFPKVHYDNGVAKQANTSNWFKPIVRCVKNARSRMIDEGSLKRETAPSYSMECLVYNAPDSVFGGSYQATYLSVLRWLERLDLSSLVTCSEQHVLCGDHPDQWRTDFAQQFRNALIDQWNRGG